MDEIYVQIPAYRDTELSATLVDLYGKARRPDRVRTGIVWQHAESDTLPDAVRNLPGLEIVAVPYRESRGCNWARNLLQRRWKGEPYTLLLDSHHRFVSGWDEMLVALHRDLERAGIERPLLTAYLPAYSPESDPGTRRKQPYKIYPLCREEGILVRLTSFPIPYWKALDRPVEADFASLHFLFGRGELNNDLLFDPDIYFFGDEVVTGLRAFTHGYDMYHPHRIVGWHCYDRRSRVPHWDDHPDWHLRHARGLTKMRRLVQGKVAGPYGLGHRRTVAQYEQRIMIPLIAAAR
jgi:hypothetical protein